MEDELLSRQQGLPLRAASGFKGMTSMLVFVVILGTNSIAGVAIVVLSCQTTFGIQVLDFLLGFTPLAFSKTGRPKGSSTLIS